MTTSVLNELNFGPDIGPYKTSWTYGGTDRSISNATESTTLSNYLKSLTGAAAQAAWDGLSPADQQTMTVTVDVDPSSISNQPIEAPDDGGANAAASTGHGCRKSLNSNKVRAKAKFFPDYDVATVTLRTRFC